MLITRNLLLRASRNRWLARELPRRRFVRRAVRRFMPGEDVSAALEVATSLAAAGLGSVFTHLGENVGSAAEAQAERDHYIRLLGQIREQALPAHISVKLTHLGLDADVDACVCAVTALVECAVTAGSFVWIDMEDSRYVDLTLDVFRRARSERSNVGLCLQAYLRRTAADLDALLPLAPAIRLVKGAYREPEAVAFPDKQDVDDNYFTLADRLLARAAEGHATPVFGTHDARLIRRIRQRAASVGVEPHAYEFHLMYGIRAAEQRALAAEGAAVRVLISYGSDWFPWYMRRLAERPANVWFVLKNLV